MACHRPERHLTAEQHLTAAAWQVVRSAHHMVHAAAIRRALAALRSSQATATAAGTRRPPHQGAIMADAPITRLTDRETQEIKRANESGRTPIVFVHGLWLLSSSWQHWQDFFESNGYTTIAPGWPDDPATIEEAH